MVRDARVARPGKAGLAVLRKHPGRARSADTGVRHSRHAARVSVQTENGVAVLRSTCGFCVAVTEIVGVTVDVMVDKGRQEVTGRLLVVPRWASRAYFGFHDWLRLVQFGAIGLA